jgi:hypothetical protein
MTAPAGMVTEKGRVRGRYNQWDWEQVGPMCALGWGNGGQGKSKAYAAARINQTELSTPLRPSGTGAASRQHLRARTQLEGWGRGAVNTRSALDCALKQGVCGW